MKNAEEFALQAVGYARASLIGTVKAEGHANPLFALAEYLDPIQFVIDAWGAQHPLVTLPTKTEFTPYIVHQLEEECPRLAPYLAKHQV